MVNKYFICLLLCSCSTFSFGQLQTKVYLNNTKDTVTLNIKNTSDSIKYKFILYGRVHGSHFNTVGILNNNKEIVLSKDIGMGYPTLQGENKEELLEKQEHTIKIPIERDIKYPFTFQYYIITTTRNKQETLKGRHSSVYSETFYK